MFKVIEKYWTEKVKEDMEELRIPADFNFLKSKSKNSFKQLVKTQVKKYAFINLMEKKKKHSKMDSIEYEELKKQDYFSIKGINVEEVRNIFKIRTRMAPYGQNFRDGQETVSCPLCEVQADDQVHGFQCEEIKNKIEINIEVEDIYQQSITKQMAEEVTNILKAREKLIEAKKRK